MARRLEISIAASLLASLPTPVAGAWGVYGSASGNALDPTCSATAFPCGNAELNSPTDAEMVAWSARSPDTVLSSVLTEVDGPDCSAYGAYDASLLLLPDTVLVSHRMSPPEEHRGFVLFDRRRVRSCTEEDLGRNVVQEVPLVDAAAQSDHILLRWPRLRETGSVGACAYGADDPAFLVGYNVYRVDAGRFPTAVSTAAHYAGQVDPSGGGWIAFAADPPDPATPTELTHQDFSASPGVSYSYVVQPVFEGAPAAQGSFDPSGTGYAPTFGGLPLVGTDSNLASYGSVSPGPFLRPVVRSGADVLGTFTPDASASFHSAFRGTLATLAGAVYDHRVSLGADRATHTADDVGDCSVDMFTNTFVDPNVLGDGMDYYYLVVGFVDSATPTAAGFGEDSAGNPRPAGAADCVP